jgi:predicted RNA-binding Zn-ribbon protein involved in translation (DUF1610 family)
MERADKRIPVTKDTWIKLHSLKRAGMTFDELLNRLINIGWFKVRTTNEQTCTAFICPDCGMLFDYPKHYEEGDPAYCVFCGRKVR